MKKLLLTFSAVITLFSAAKAQAPDFGFEGWTNVPFSTTVQDPNGWASLNALTLVGTAQSVFKETTTPAAGTASAKIVTVKVNGASIPNPYTTGNIDTAGLLVIGKTQLSAPYLIYGYSYAWRPATLSFSSKYTPMTGDSAFVLVNLTHWNGTTRDTIAKGKYATGASSTSYAMNNVSMVYKPAFASVMPDSEEVFVSSSVYSHAGAKIGSTFYIDNLSWSGYVSTNDIAGIVSNVSIFPNPATDRVNFKIEGVNGSFVEISDVTGRVIGLFPMMNNEAKVETADYKTGLYLYNVLNSKKEVVNRGKFEIAK